MDSMFEDDISILTQEALGPDEDWLDSPNTDLSGEMCSASHFALITAYDDIKNRLTALERENSTLKRRLKMYEVKYPLIGEFGEEHIFSLYEAKETSLLKSEKAGRSAAGTQPRPLAAQRALVETHLSRIRSLEQQLRQRDSGAFPGLGGQDVPFIALHPNPGLSHGEPPPSPPRRAPPGTPRRCRGLSRAVPAVLERAGGWQSRGLEAELEAARQENQRAQHREEQLKAECERLQAELKHLQDTREQEQSERDMAWVKKVGDDQ
ncbi:TBKB1 protein, partial [Chaetorhynchus papuensis]|nr:TBKB1 protein [Chaetorhynchus papuensis]